MANPGAAGARPVLGRGPGAAGAHIVVVQVYVCDFVTLANVTRAQASTMSALVQSLQLKLLAMN